MGAGLKVSLEVIEPVPHILIAGGGHVGKSVPRVCIRSAGNTVSLMLEVSSPSSQQRFPTATETVSCSVADFLKKEKSSSLSRFSDVLVLGHDWSVDQELLIGLLRDFQIALG